VDALDKVRVGIVGTGTISNYHANAYLNHKEVEMYAVYDVNMERAQQFARKYAVKHVYTDYEEMLQDTNLDAVSVCVWNYDHATVAIKALRAGKHVLCEKPLAINLQEAEEINRVAKQYGKVLMVGFVKRFFKNTMILKDFIDKGDFGDIYFVKGAYTRRFGNPGGWFADKTRSGGGPLIDLGVHIIDTAMYLMGNPRATTVSGITSSGMGVRPHIQGVHSYKSADFKAFCDVEDFCGAMIRFDNGAALWIETSFGQHVKNDSLSLHISGTKSGASLEPKVEIYKEQDGYLVDIAPYYSEEADPMAEGFNREIASFVDSITGKALCVTPVEDGLEIMRIVDAIYTSASTGHEVRIERQETEMLQTKGMA